MTVQQAIEMADAGRRVAIIGRTARLLVNDAAAIAQQMPSTIAISRTNGAQAITFEGGGKLTFHRIGAELRGTDLDVAYLTDVRDAETMDEIAPCFDTRPQRIAALI